MAARTASRMVRSRRVPITQARAASRRPGRSRAPRSRQMSMTLAGSAGGTGNPAAGRPDRARPRAARRAARPARRAWGWRPAAPRVYGCRGSAHTSAVRPTSTILPEVHDRDPVGDQPHHRQVVADEQQPGARVHGEVAHQAGDLRLGRRVQRRDGLVADQQPRPGGQRPGDRDALPLAAGELVRVPAGEVARQPDPFQQVGGGGWRCRPPYAARRRSGRPPGGAGSATRTGPGTPSGCPVRPSCGAGRAASPAARRR